MCFAMGCFSWLRALSTVILTTADFLARVLISTSCTLVACDQVDDYNNVASITQNRKQINEIEIKGYGPGQPGLGIGRNDVLIDSIRLNEKVQYIWIVRNADS